MSAMDEGRFAARADETLAGLMERLEDALGDRADVDLQDGILTIDLDAGGRYVINKHAANRQIWLSSPVSGANHFSFDDAQGWVDTRGGAKLTAILERELAAAAGSSIDLG